MKCDKCSTELEWVREKGDDPYPHTNEECFTVQLAAAKAALGVAHLALRGCAETEREDGVYGDARQYLDATQAPTEALNDALAAAQPAVRDLTDEADVLTETNKNPRSHALRAQLAELKREITAGRIEANAELKRGFTEALYRLHAERDAEREAREAAERTLAKFIDTPCAGCTTYMIHGFCEHSYARALAAQKRAESRVERLERAMIMVVRKGHHDTCSHALIESHACDCGFDAGQDAFESFIKEDRAAALRGLAASQPPAGEQRLRHVLVGDRCKVCGEKFANGWPMVGTWCSGQPPAGERGGEP